MPLARLNSLELRYDSNDMLTRIDYTTNESEFASLTTICTFEYEYDDMDRPTRISCQAPNEPNLVVSIDPNIPNDGDYTVVQCEYDPVTHLYLWSVNAWTLADNAITRAIYSDVTAGPDSSDRLMLEIALTATNGIPAIISYEYDSTGRRLRSSDLRGGHITVYEDYEPVGAGGEGQYVVELLPDLGGGGGGGGCSYGLLGGGGQYYFPLAGGGSFGLYAVPLGGGGSYGLFGFDEYANLDILIEQEQLPDGEGGLISMAKKKVCKKAAKKKTAPTGCKQLLEGDINGDCKVNMFDIAKIADQWLCDYSP